MTNDETNVAPILMYSTNWCPDCHRAKYLLDEYGIPYTNIDVDVDKEGLAFVKQVNNGRRVVPTIVFPDNSILVEPTNRQLAEKAGIEL
ncbi:MAG: glutathione S-transferase N-terminal domain-containing protein [Anaerolineales bacterium]|nr:glutathione S-transferase N-terminal domain-containing protein [Anaerolineales bacterium]MCB8937957.1 glutathione S-transferase N-terminal domain-containing protein [Ardenticatenaceae bacterium]